MTSKFFWYYLDYIPHHDDKWASLCESVWFAPQNGLAPIYAGENTDITVKWHYVVESLERLEK